MNTAGAVSCPQVSPVHKVSCSSLALSEDGRYLLTAGDKVLKVWDYRMRFDVNFQVLPTEGGEGLGLPCSNISESLEKRAASVLSVTWSGVPSPCLC